jgi:NhaP-type Na+/H+ or K+/H+ antiporter
LLLGGLLSATDPVAVVALLKELGASKKLSTIIEGESLMNDGTAIVVYQLFYRMVLGRTFDAGLIIKFLSEVSLGAVALGLAFGIVSVLWLGFIFNDTIIEISLTLAVSYIAFFTVRPFHFRSPYFPLFSSEALVLLMFIHIRHKIHWRSLVF